MLGHFERLHTHVHMDFMQIELFRNALFPTAERIEYIATSMDALKLLYIYVDDDALLLALESDEPVEPIVAVIKGTLGWPPNQNS